MTKNNKAGTLNLRLIVDNSDTYLKRPWTREEIKLFEDIADFRRQSGSDNAAVHGVSDEEEPWISIINETNGRISIHCTRHQKGGYIMLGENRKPTYWRNLGEIEEKLLTSKCVG